MHQTAGTSSPAKWGANGLHPAGQSDEIKFRSGGITKLENWDEVRTAYQVARMGTVSGAADILGVHHATVIRHIDALEKRLGARLFQRHARGYTPTEAGRDLLLVAQTTEEQFGQLVSRIKGQGDVVSGELVITAITGMSDLLMPVLGAFQQSHPAVSIRFLTDMRLFRLDYGEAHVAIRAGAAPQEPDNVAQPLISVRIGLYASRDYIARHGMPADEADLVNHRFVSTDNPEARAPFTRWLKNAVPASSIMFRVTEPAAIESAIENGLALGFVAVWKAAKNPNLIEIIPCKPEWSSPLWIVTHVDLHRTLKVQSFLTHLKQAVAGWVGV